MALNRTRKNGQKVTSTCIVPQLQMQLTKSPAWQRLGSVPCTQLPSSLSIRTFGQSSPEACAFLTPAVGRQGPKQV